MPEWAIQASRQAAEAGHIGAAYNLAVLLEDRLDPPDLDGARRWYEQAAEAGDTDAMANLGNPARGPAGAAGPGRCPPLVPAGCRGRRHRRHDQLGNPARGPAGAAITDAMVNLGILLANRLEPPDLDGARHWFQQGAEAGNTGAMVNLGVLLGDRLEPPHLDGAHRWYQQATEAVGIRRPGALPD